MNYQDLTTTLNKIGWHKWFASVQSGEQWSVIELSCIADGRLRTVLTLIDDGNYRLGTSFNTLNIKERQLLLDFANQSTRQCFTIKPVNPMPKRGLTYLIR